MMQQHYDEYNARLHPKCKIETRGKRYNFDEFGFQTRLKFFSPIFPVNSNGRTVNKRILNKRT